MQLHLLEEGKHMATYRLPDFHLTMDVWRSAGFGAPPSVLYSAGVSCQAVHTRGELLIIKCPKGTNLPINGQAGATMFTWFNLPAGSNNWYESQGYMPVALHYSNEYEQYGASYSNTLSVLPH